MSFCIHKYINERFLFSSFSEAFPTYPHFVQKPEDNSCSEQIVIQQSFLTGEGWDESLQTFVLIPVRCVAVEILGYAEVSC